MHCLNVYKREGEGVKGQVEVKPGDFSALQIRSDQIRRKGMSDSAKKGSIYTF